MRTVGDGAGHHGETVLVRAGDSLRAWRRDAEQLSLLVANMTKLAAVPIPCRETAGTTRCELTSSQPERLRLGAVKDVTFFLDTTQLGAGKLQISVSNDGLPGGFVTIELAEGEHEREKKEKDVSVRVRRGVERTYVSVARGEELNGDWGLSVLAGRGGAP